MSPISKKVIFFSYFFLVFLVFLVPVIYSLFGVKGVYYDSCIDDEYNNNTFVNGTRTSFCVILFDNPLYTFTTRGFYILGHFIVPFLFMAILGAYVFAIASYAYNGKHGYFEHERWNWLYSFAYLFFFLLGLGVMNVHESIEKAFCMFGSAYFCENIKLGYADTLGDTLLCIVAEIYIIAVVVLRFIKPVAYLIMDRSWKKHILYFFLNVCMIVSMIFGPGQFESRTGRLTHVGFATTLPILWIWFFTFMLIDLKDVKKHSLISKTEVIHFWIWITITTTILWLCSFEFILPTYLSVLIGTAISFLVTFMMKTCCFRLCCSKSDNN